MRVDDPTTDETTAPGLHASDHLLTRPRPLIPLAPGFVRVLHRVSLIWAVVVVVFLEVSRRALWLQHEPGTETFEIAATCHLQVTGGAEETADPSAACLPVPCGKARHGSSSECMVCQRCVVQTAASASSDAAVT